MLDIRKARNHFKETYGFEDLHGSVDLAFTEGFLMGYKESLKPKEKTTKPVDVKPIKKKDFAAKLWGEKPSKALVPAKKKRRTNPLKCNTAAGMASRMEIMKVLEAHPYPLSVQAVTKLLNGKMTKYTVQSHLRLMAVKGIAVRTRELGTLKMLYNLKGVDKNEKQEEKQSAEEQIQERQEEKKPFGFFQ